MEKSNENLIEAYPLCWPGDYPRAKSRKYARFKTSFAIARDSIVAEVKRLGGKDVIISTNIPLKRDGLPYATYKQPEDPGVAVYFTFKGEQRVFCCDEWTSIHDNMQAINKTIEAIRGLDRWGVSDMLNRVFSGFAALPQSTNKKAWYEVLKVAKNSEVATIKSAYRQLMMVHHPDKNNGKTSPMFTEIQTAYEEAKKELGFV